MLSWPLPVQAAMHGQTEIGVGFYETSYSTDRIVSTHVVPDGGHPYFVKSVYPGIQNGSKQPRASMLRQPGIIAGWMGDPTRDALRLPQMSERLIVGGILGGMGLLASTLVTALHRMLKQQDGGA